MTPYLGIEPGPHWWKASALTTAPSLHPKLKLIFPMENHVNDVLVSVQLTLLKGVIFPAFYFAGFYSATETIFFGLGSIRKICKVHRTRKIIMLHGI